MSDGGGGGGVCLGRHTGETHKGQLRGTLGQAMKRKARRVWYKLPDKYRTLRYTWISYKQWIIFSISMSIANLTGCPVFLFAKSDNPSVITIAHSVIVPKQGLTSNWRSGVSKYLAHSCLLVSLKPLGSLVPSQSKIILHRTKGSDEKTSYIACKTWVSRSQ